MAFVNDEGISISFECSELIEQLKQDINAFGGEKIVIVKCKEQMGVEIYTDYSLEKDIKLKDGEYLKSMTMTALLIVFEQENSII